MAEDWIQEDLPKEIKTKIKNKSETKELAERYHNMQLDPGEAVGVITAQSLGEPGTQMSVRYDEKVIVKFKDKVRTIKIGEFIEQIIEIRDVVKENDVEIYDLPRNNKIEVLSLNNEEKLVWKELKAISRHKNAEELLKLKLRSGREITATKTHSFVIRKDNKIVPIAGKDLTIGDRIPVMRSLNFNHEINSINISMFTKAAKHKLPQVLELTEQVGWLFGAYLAEGNATQHFVNISNNSAVFMQQIQDFSTAFDLTMNVYHHARGFSNSTDIRINSTMLSNVLKAHCGTGSYNKKIPDFAINANKEFLQGLLRAYFDGDGNISTERNMIRTYSKSKELIEGISILLNRFGIFSRKSRNKDGYTLSISYRYANLFLNEIGLDIPDKLNKLKELVNSKDTKQQYNVTEMYVGFSDVLHKLAKKLNYPLRLVNNFTKRQKIGRTTLDKYIKLFSKLSKEKNINVKAELDILKQMYASDVIWDEIIGLEYVTDEHGYLYDFSVNGLETFTTSEGIITHNTMRTFHFVGVAELNVTLGLPRIIEILDARKEPKTPAMFIYLKAPHNKTYNSANKIAQKIKQVVLDQISDEFTLDLINSKLMVRLNPDLLKNYSLTIPAVVDTLKKQLKGINILSKNRDIIISAKDKDIKKLYKLKEKIRDMYISGVSNITHVLAIEKDGEFVIQTFGSNLKKVVEIPEVDENRVTTNNIIEIGKLFGIEAVRAAIVNEIMQVLEEEGLDVDIRHVMLIADTMCKRGDVKGITRHGIASQKQSVLARASFEIPLKHLIEASVIGEEDKLTSVVENIMINQPIPIGTGLPDLVVKMRNIKTAAKPKSKVKPKAATKSKPKSGAKKKVKK